MLGLPASVGPLANATKRPLLILPPAAPRTGIDPPAPGSIPSGDRATAAHAAGADPLIPLVGAPTPVTDRQRRAGYQPADDVDAAQREFYEPDTVGGLGPAQRPFGLRHRLRDR